MLGTIKHAPGCKGRGINPKIYPCTCGATQRQIKLFLQHAQWHCLFGSDNAYVRDPDANDNEAANILKGLVQDKPYEQLP